MCHGNSILLPDVASSSGHLLDLGQLYLFQIIDLGLRVDSETMWKKDWSRNLTPEIIMQSVWFSLILDTFCGDRARQYVQFERMLCSSLSFNTSGLVMKIGLFFYDIYASLSRIGSTEFLTLFGHPSLSSIAPGRSSWLHFVSAHSWSKSLLVGQHWLVFIYGSP